jgi:hypothetical protein
MHSVTMEVPQYVVWAPLSVDRVTEIPGTDRVRLTCIHRGPINESEPAVTVESTQELETLRLREALDKGQAFPAADKSMAFALLRFADQAGFIGFRLGQVVDDVNKRLDEG